jgi:hypothetical protein
MTTALQVRQSAVESHSRRATGAVIAARIASTDNPRSPIISGQWQPSCNRTSRMKQRFTSGPVSGQRLKFRRPTRHLRSAAQPPRVAVEHDGLNDLIRLATLLTMLASMRIDQRG